MKGVAIFGGVQFFLAIISILRIKFAAVLLGSAGVGLLNLFLTAISLINQISGMGIHLSGVRDTAKARGENDIIEISKIIVIINRLVLVTSVLGAIITIIFSRQLSIWTFGTDSYMWSFIYLSIAVAFNTISTGLSSLLQGMRMLKALAKSSVISSAIGLVINIPLYYFWGKDGIVPAIIMTSIITLCFALYYSRQIDIVKVDVSITETIQKSKNIIKIGYSLVFTGLFLTLTAYLFNLFLFSQGGDKLVGLYSSGWALTTQYVGLIFIAMTTDYFPRLSSVSDDNTKLSLIVNHQAQIGLFILTPISIGLITFALVVVRIVLSSEFIEIVPLIQFSLAGMLFKCISWAMANVIVAKGDVKLFLITEFLGNIMFFSLNIIGYKIAGFLGVGIAFIVNYLLYTLIVWAILVKRYNLNLDKYTVKFFVLQQLMVLLVLMCLFIFPNSIVFYIFGAIVFVSSIYYSFRQLDKLISIKELIISRFKK